LIEPDRNDLGVRVPRNDFITPLQTQQRSPSFQLPFRKHTHDFAFVELFRSDANCTMRLTLANWDAPNRAQDRMQNRLVIIFVVDDVADRPGTGELQDEGVHPADVIRHEKKPASRQVFQTAHSDAIKAAHQWPAKEIERPFGSGLGLHGL
jgi:hypothetical protein